jgi:hypothetical protein
MSPKTTFAWVTDDRVSSSRCCHSRECLWQGELASDVFWDRDNSRQRRIRLWGWRDFTGGVTSCNSGDCQFAQYVHAPAGNGFTCHVSIDLTTWTGAGGTFVITGDASANPAAVAIPCLVLFPGSATFAGVDTGFPSAPGHYNLGSFGVPGAVAEFNITVTQVP